MHHRHGMPRERSLVFGSLTDSGSPNVGGGGSLAEGGLPAGGRGEVGQHDAEPPGLIG
jgi:hypothetical protein